MNYKEIYELWMNNPYFDQETQEDLKNIQADEKEIEDRFYRDLEFGTGGLRGVIGAGTNRMNRYIVRKASQGLATFLNKNYRSDKAIAIAYDSRNKSDIFAEEAALIFAANGIKAYLFDELKPTPELSFAVRDLKCQAGIVITASHNPKEYNGYKVYGEDGGQIPLEASNLVLDEINGIEDITKLVPMDKEEALKKGLLVLIGQEVDDRYMSALKTLSINPQMCQKVGKDYKIIFTPIHGAGNKPVRRILKETGFEKVYVVSEQELPDPMFSTVKYPNPEEKAVFDIAVEMAKKEQVDLIIGTDPDCDRVGIVVKNPEGEYVTFTGNQTGCLMLEYILSQKKALGTLPEKAFVVKTIVTTELSRKIAENYGVTLIEVLTGFKFIGEQIKLLDEEGDHKYLFGFEESYGYLAGTFSRDKDAVVASMLIAEMAAYYASQDMTLYDALQALYKKYGYTIESLDSFTLKGKEGIEKIQNAMLVLRQNEISRFGDIEVNVIRDYKMAKRIHKKTGKIEKLTLPESDVLYYELDNAWFCIRPSGTEPKIKIYYGVTSRDYESASADLNRIKENVLKVVQPYLK